MRLLMASMLMLTATGLSADMRIVSQRSASPLVTFRVVFLTGTTADPAGKEGAATLTASMLAQAGTRQQTYKQIVEAMFPMATSVSRQVDKEMTVFSATTHVDNLEAFYPLFRSMLRSRWRADDLRVCGMTRSTTCVWDSAVTTTRNSAKRFCTTSSTTDVLTATRMWALWRPSKR